MIRSELKSYKPYKNGFRDRVLEIGDLHEPFSLDEYLSFCREIQEKYRCSKVIFMGDLMDQHGVNYHEHNPDGMSHGKETLVAVSRLKAWYKTFPNSKVCLGNHDLLAYRKMHTHGISKIYAVEFRKVIQAPRSWNIGLDHIINNVFHTHGTGVSGVGGAFKIMQQNRMSTVIGHLHSESNIRFSASYKDLLFAKTVGCGINYKLYAFDYGKNFVSKPIINVGVTLENGTVPLLIPMNL